ncbi:MAG TPA: hypothetical protein H9902_13620 [Candidatus Stackebrandtia faecavium]|nr:hypothetical protein [Candidatus Stackebrandtia faecavium]
MTRIYLPATFATLTTLHNSGEVSASGAHAVTPTLRQSYEGLGEEDLEYVAFCSAATAAFGRLADDADSVSRRVVISADVPERAVKVETGAEDGSTVSLAEPVTSDRVAAIHVDGQEAADVVAAAVTALASAAQDPASAEKALDEADDFELEWYDPTELPQLVEQA